MSEKKQLEEKLSEMSCYQENFEQWQLSIEQIKQERDKVSIVIVNVVKQFHCAKKIEVCTYLIIVC